ncbi:MAG: putative DNA binding domain-containing protein [Hydrogenibacillus sp.]|nr:putative DNA binding domain-containing protein [Hydrogenibacillus sp.]
MNAHTGSSFACSTIIISDFKRVRNGLDPGVKQSARRNICAFANDPAGTGQEGYILIGVHDDGGCSGIRITAL